MRRWYKRSLVRYSTPTLKFLLLSVGALGLAGFTKLAEMTSNLFIAALGRSEHLNWASYVYVILAFAMTFVIVAIVERVTRSDERHIRYLIIKRLCKYKYGNPLHLKDGELEPKIQVHKTDIGYRVRVSCPSVEFEKVASLDTVISDCLRGRFEGFSVVGKEEDVACRYVDYFLDDEEANAEKQTVYHSLEDMKR